MYPVHPYVSLLPHQTRVPCPPQSESVCYPTSQITLSVSLSPSLSVSLSLSLSLSLYSARHVWTLPSAPLTEVSLRWFSACFFWPRNLRKDDTHQSRIVFRRLIWRSPQCMCVCVCICAKLGCFVSRGGSGGSFWWCRGSKTSRIPVSLRSRNRGLGTKWLPPMWRSNRS